MPARAVVQPVERADARWTARRLGRGRRLGAFAHRVVEPRQRHERRAARRAEPGRGRLRPRDARSCSEDVDADGRRGPSDLPLAIGGVAPIAGRRGARSRRHRFDVPPATPDAAAALVVAGTTQLDGVVAAVVDSARALAPIGPPSLAFYRDAGFRTVTRGLAGRAVALSPGRRAWRQPVAQTPARPRHVHAHRRGNRRRRVPLATTRPRCCVRRVPASRLDSESDCVFARRGLSSHLTGILETHENDKVIGDAVGLRRDGDAGDGVDRAGTGPCSIRSPTRPSRAPHSTRRRRWHRQRRPVPGGPARVFDADGVTPAPSEFGHRRDGRYLFAVARRAHYRL